jgi:hypothetical protein
MAGAGEGAAAAPPHRSVWLLGSVALIAAAAIIGGLAGAGLLGADKQGPSPAPVITESAKSPGDGIAPQEASAGVKPLPPSPATGVTIPGPAPVSTGVDASGNAAPAPGGLLAGLNALMAGQKAQQGVAQVRTPFRCRVHIH